MRPLAAAVVLVWAAPSFAQDAAAARAVVQKAVDAAGGAEKLAKLKAGTAQLKGQMTLNGIDTDIAGSMAYQLPALYKLELTADVAGQKMRVEQLVKDGKLSHKLNGVEQPLQDKVTAEMKMALRLLEVSQLVPLLDAGRFTLTAEKDADVDGKPAAVVLVQSKEFKDTRLFFDKGTGLLVRTERKSLAPAPGGTDLVDVTETTTLSDYRKVDGVLLPFKSVVLHDGKKYLTFGYTEAKLLEAVDPKLIQ
jgi:hypothetical protein